MGNTGSCEGPYADIELVLQTPPLVVIDERFVRPEVTRLRLMETSSYSKNLSFKDVLTKEVMFRTGPEWEFNALLDADKKPIVNVATKKDIKGIYYVYRPEDYVYRPEDVAGADQDDTNLIDSELLQIYVKQGLITRTGYLDTTLRVDFTDLTTGERCKITMEGEWRARSAMLWLQRGHDNARAPVGRIYRPPKAMRNGFTLEIAPNIDTALVLLICAVVDDDLKRLRKAENSRAGWDLTTWRL